MFRCFFQRVTLLLLSVGLLFAPAALAQAPAPTATAPAGLNAYTGPRFPGGPDSLRATLRRAAAMAGPALKGQLFVRLELSQSGQPTRCTLLPPADQAATELARRKEVLALVQQLPAKLGQWQVGSGADRTQPGNVIVLPLDFSPQATPAPLPYSDDNPAFISLTDKNTASLQRAVNFLQRQFRYPAEDLRNQVQGTVYGYFEVSETGAVENRRVVGSLTPSIDAELRRVLNSLPTALTPPRQQGRLVRVAYVLPVSLRIL